MNFVSALRLPVNLPFTKASLEVSQDFLDFQNGIKQGNFDVVKLLVSDGMSVNNPLPNGELPLHLAVRSGRQEIVTLLLQLGADPEIKDFQQLSAIDHAVLMKNESMLATILGFKIGKELQEVQEQIKCKGSEAHVNQLKAKIQAISTINIQNLSPLSKAAYQGNLDDLTKQREQDINELDGQGFEPIHYAILGNQLEAVEMFIKLGSNTNILNSKGDSLLHFAAIGGSKPILNKLISLGLDPNHKNSEGETPLHYASAKENLALVEALIKGGANPHLHDNQGMSSLALIGTSAFLRDPLSLPKTQVILFAASSLMWISSLAISGGWVTSDYAAVTTSLLLLGSAVAANWSEFAVLVTNLNKTWKKVVAWMCMFGLATIPPLNVGFQAWRTYHVARVAFEGLKNCWRNFGYRNWAVTRNIVVYGANTANSMHSLYVTSRLTFEIFMNAPYWFRMTLATYNDDKEAFFEAYVDYLRFLKSRYNLNDEIVNVNECAQVDPTTLSGLNNVDRLLKPELNPQCPEHALMMMSPEFTMDALREQGVSLYKGVYRQMMIKEVHPDKAGANKTIEEAAVRLNVASETLKKWIEKNK